jgi:hypothetical protein
MHQIMRKDAGRTGEKQPCLKVLQQIAGDRLYSLGLFALANGGQFYRVGLLGAVRNARRKLRLPVRLFRCMN